jgi:glycosyltransferase involved in cell wall biosynthesis
LTAAGGTKATYVATLLKRLVRDPAFDLIVCGHINLLPLAYIAKQHRRAPILLVIHGIDAWQPTRSRLVNLLAKRVDGIASVSDHTRRRFLSWAPACEGKVHLLPNVAHTERFGPGPPPAGLLQRYGLDGRRVLLTLGRLDTAERYKGVDEMLEILSVWHAASLSSPTSW